MTVNLISERVRPTSTDSLKPSIDPPHIRVASCPSPALQVHTLELTMEINQFAIEISFLTVCAD